VSSAQGKADLFPNYLSGVRVKTVGVCVCVCVCVCDACVVCVCVRVSVNITLNSVCVEGGDGTTCTSNGPKHVL